MYDTSFCREFYALQLLYETISFPQKFDLPKIHSKNYFEGRHKGAETSGIVSPGGVTFLRG